MTLDDVMARRSQILEFARARSVSRVRLFGSVVRGESGPQSDVDFLVDFEHGASALDQAGLVRQLKGLLGVDVEVVSAGGLQERYEGNHRQAVDL
jgi:uncharacterized protein